MKKTVSLLALIIIILSGCSEKGHKTVSKKDAAGYNYEEVTNDPYRARIYTLGNGLKVYLSKNVDEPRVQTIFAVRAGAKEDPRDNTGLAHYLEHMMFKGTNNFGTINWEAEAVLLDSIHQLFELHKATDDPAARKAIYADIDRLSQAASLYAVSNEYDKLVSAIGASGTNAFTSYDMTCYINEIPSNEIERFLMIESDRFANLQLRLFHTELETVYEEFNMYQDMGGRLVVNKLFDALFAEHPYRIDVIGLPEHLKSPSMNSVMDFYRHYYVPNNMAVCMTGDLDYDATIKLIDQYFGQTEANPDLKHPERIVEKPLAETTSHEVSTPDQELVAVGYRSDNPILSEETIYLELISAILRNGKAGIIDIDMIQKQKVLRMYAGHNQFKDYGIFLFQGYPREGQTLEEVTVLIQDVINKLKAGDFDDDLLQAVINNKKLSEIHSADSREACYEFMEAFINEIPWQDYISRIDRMSKITKQELVDFANKFFASNYVTVYKRTGENKDKVEVEKPHITPIAINRDDESAFAQQLLAMEVAPIEPVFTDFEQAIEKKEVKQGIDFYYTKNVDNGLYYLAQFADISNKTDKKLALAFRYLPYLGTSRYTPEELKLEIYKLAMSFSPYFSNNRAFINISGLDGTMNEAIALLQEILTEVVPDEEAYANLVDDIIKERQNSKLNKSTILRSGMVNYVKYGAENPFTDILSEEELRAIKPQELVDMIKSFAGYERSYVYYGPQEDKQMVAKINEINPGDELKATPAQKHYPELPMDKPMVYFVNYDMVQAEIMYLAKDGVFDPALSSLETLFDVYYGTSMNSVVFQEIREARGLAYSAYTYLANPSQKGYSTYIQGYVGTQADKMHIAMDAFSDLLTTMKTSEKAFSISKEYCINNIRTARIKKQDAFWVYQQMQDMGIPSDNQKRTYEQIQAMQLSDLESYFGQHISPAHYSVLIVGKRENIDFKYLNKIAQVKELSLEEVFGY